MKTSPTLAKLLGATGLVVVLGACASTATTATPTTRVPSAATPTTRGATAATVAPAGTSATSSKAAGTTQAPEAVVAGDIPDNQAFVAYSGTGYTIKVPEGWARSADGTATVFTDKYNSIRIETMAMATAPTAASVSGTELPAIAKVAKGYTAGKVSAVTRKAGQAILATYQMDGIANGVTNKTVRLDVERYEFWKSGKATIVTLSSAAGSDNVDPWKTVTDGFGWAP